jgi:aminodeoxyfutalosine synthase
MITTEVQTRFAEIQDKVAAGERLTMEDGLVLFDPRTPLGEVGKLANQVRERLHGNVAYYNINTHLNPTNVTAVGFAPSELTSATRVATP